MRQSDIKERNMKKLKAVLRDWLFKDYKWITRAQVRREICATGWQYRNSPLVQRAIKESLKAI